MKVIAKYVTAEAVKDKQVLHLLFLDWNSRGDCLEVVKAHGMKPLTSSSGSKGVEMELEDINPETLKSVFGAMIPHDFMYYPEVNDFSDFYKKKEVKDND